MFNKRNENDIVARVEQSERCECIFRSYCKTTRISWELTARFRARNFCLCSQTSWKPVALLPHSISSIKATVPAKLIVRKPRPI